METPPNESTLETCQTAINVLRAQAQTLAVMADRYAVAGREQQNFSKCLDILHSSVVTGGKVVFTAMGKSLKIGEKLAATLNSLGIVSLTLHPTEALHGDLGCLNERDVLIMITASGNTPELLSLRDHLPAQMRWLCLTCTGNSPLGRASSGLLEAQIPLECAESSVYGLAAPTISTTACLSLGDALCVTLNEMLVNDAKLRAVRFGKWHPGGAIGQLYRQNQIIKWGDLPTLDRDLLECEEVDLWRISSSAGYVVSSFDIYSSKDLIEWLKNGRYSLPRALSLDSLPHLDENRAMAFAGDLCVVVKGDERVGLMVSV